MERVELSRGCEAIQIPAGHAVTLPQGLEVFVTQALGGSFTVEAPAYGGLFRIAGKDADAIGKEPLAPPEAPSAQGKDLEQLVWETLKTCYDPEIPVNIVDLGLIYDMQIVAKADQNHWVEVKMTLTAQGCGMGVSLAAEARQKLLDLPGVSNANVELVWDPPWNPQMISPEGKQRLGLD